LCAVGGAFLLGAARHWPDHVTRVLVYVASAFVVYALYLIAQERPLVNDVFDACLGVLTLMMLIGVRATRREVFRFDTEDALVLFLILAIPMLAQLDIDRVELSRMVLRFVALLYCCEFVLSRDLLRTWSINSSALVTLVVLALP
jgi:hypothetical protein